MHRFRIKGGKALQGSVDIQGSKNALLPLMAACVARPGKVRFLNASKIKDTAFLGEIIEFLGGTCSWEGDACLLDTSGVNSYEPSYEYVSKMRASFLLLGSLLARLGYAKIPLPGGCAIGVRPVQWHIEALKQFGAQVDLAEGFVIAKAKKLIGAKIDLPYPTVGGTQNCLMAAALAEGETFIRNAACEPEVVDLCRFLKQSGVQIQGDGTPCIHVQGASDLTFPESFHVMPDRIEALTFAVATAVTQGNLLLRGCVLDDMRGAISVLKSVGVTCTPEGSANLRVQAQGPLKPFHVVTGPYPKFSTDLQPLFMALALYCEGESTLRETVFKQRFMHALEFVRMGADLQLNDDHVRVRGQMPIKGAPVMASDLRGGAALVIAALGAEGETIVQRIYHIARGYKALNKKLSGCGASIVCEND